MSRTPLQDALIDGTDVLSRAGVASARHDAEVLAAHVAGRRRGELLLVHDLGPGGRAAYDELVARRAAREPLQHLVGSAGFRHLDILVGPGVFVPRPETESVVQWAVDALAATELAEPVVVDLCTGSAAIALSIAHEVPGARVHAVEVDPAALAWAGANAAVRASAGDPQVTLHLADVAAALPGLNDTVDLVISNPPYVSTDELPAVDPEVGEHDPGIALAAGADGLSLLRLVVGTAARLLRPGGLLAVEHSDRQGDSAPAVLRAAPGWTAVADHLDLTGRPRFVTARWSP